MPASPCLSPCLPAPWPLVGDAGETGRGSQNSVLSQVHEDLPLDHLLCVLCLDFMGRFALKCVPGSDWRGDPVVFPPVYVTSGHSLCSWSASRRHSPRTSLVTRSQPCSWALGSAALVCVSHCIELTVSSVTRASRALASLRTVPPSPCPPWPCS